MRTKSFTITIQFTRTFSFSNSYFFSLQTLHQHARLAYRQAEESNDGDALKRAKEELDIPGMAPGGVQDKNKVELAEIMAKLNQLFSGELGDHDTLAYVCSVIRGQLWESSTLRQQAAANSKEQFSNSADLNKALLDAIIGALDAHQRSKRRSSRPCMPSAACATTSPTALVNPLRLHRAIRSASNGHYPEAEPSPLWIALAPLLQCQPGLTAHEQSFILLVTTLVASIEACALFQNPFSPRTTVRFRSR